MLEQKHSSEANTNNANAPGLANRARSIQDKLQTYTSRQWLFIVCWAILAIGVIARLSPFFDPQDRLLWQYMTEDGYLMQTVARNMAIGLGMSTAEGTIPTNGVQPLATYLFAFCHLLAGGEKTIGIALVTLMSLGFSVLAALAFHNLANRLLSDMTNGSLFALMLTSVWFVGPLPLAHSMNGLETSLL